MLPVISAYGKNFGETKYMTFWWKRLITKQYNKIWDKVSNIMKRGFDSEPVYNGKYVKTEIKYYEGLINTNFHGGKVPQEGYQCICLSIILIDCFCNR